MATLPTIRKEWDDFASKVIPTNAPEIQIIETRRAFYAGFYSMLQQCMRMGENDISEEAGVVHLEILHSEIKQFYRDMRTGKV